MESPSTNKWGYYLEFTASPYIMRYAGFVAALRGPPKERSGRVSILHLAALRVFARLQLLSVDARDLHGHALQYRCSNGHGCQTCRNDQHFTNGASLQVAHVHVTEAAYKVQTTLIQVSNIEGVVTLS